MKLIEGFGRFIINTIIKYTTNVYRGMKISAALLMKQDKPVLTRIFRKFYLFLSMKFFKIIFRTLNVHCDSLSAS